MIKVGKISKKQLLNMERSARREADIETGMNFNRHRVWQNKKKYNRKKNKKVLVD